MKKSWRKVPEPWIRELVRKLVQAAESANISITVYRDERIHFSYSNCHELALVRLCMGPPSEADAQILKSIPCPSSLRKEVWVPIQGRGLSFQIYTLGENDLLKWLQVYFEVPKAAAREPLEKIGCVYFVLNSVRGLVKIGHSNNAKRRAMELRSHNLDDLAVLHVIRTDDPLQLEKKLHLRFSAQRVKGEWFQYSDEIKRFLESGEAHQ